MTMSRGEKQNRTKYRCSLILYEGQRQTVLTDECFVFKFTEKSRSRSKCIISLKATISQNNHMDMALDNCSSKDKKR